MHDQSGTAVSDPIALDLRQAALERYVTDGGLGTFSAIKLATHAHNLLPLVRDVPRNAPILEIGPGLGELLHCLRGAHFTQVEACDGSPEVVAACASRGFPVEQISSIPDFLASRESRYGAVFMIDIVEHLTKKEAFEALRAVRNALRPGGHVIIQVPNMQSPFASTNLYWDITHEVGYTEYSMRQLCSSAGFSNVQLFSWDYPPQGIYHIKRLLRSIWYLGVKSVMLIDQWNRGSILTPNLIARASR
jgi:SAM-dependent methyltransferase